MADTKSCGKCLYFESSRHYLVGKCKKENSLKNCDRQACGKWQPIDPKPDEWKDEKEPNPDKPKFTQKPKPDGKVSDCCFKSVIAHDVASGDDCKSGESMYYTCHACGKECTPTDRSAQPDNFSDCCGAEMSFVKNVYWVCCKCGKPCTPIEPKPAQPEHGSIQFTDAQKKMQALANGKWDSKTIDEFVKRLDEMFNNPHRDCDIEFADIKDIAKEMNNHGH